MQICATRGGDYAVTHETGVHLTLQGVGRYVHAWAHDGVTSCWTKSHREGTTEAVFEEYLEAGAENAPLLQFQGSQDEVCGGGGSGNFESLMGPFADGEGGGVPGLCCKGSLLWSEGGWIGVVGLGSKQS